MEPREHEIDDEFYDDELDVSLATTPAWKLTGIAVFLFGVLVILGAFLACATPTHNYVPPLPPAPGSNINDWSARAADGGVRG